MSSALVNEQSATFVQPRPEVRPGYTVRVHEKIVEGDKERIQIFEGLVIAVHKGATAGDHTITVRRIASGVGVEKVFSLHSPKIEQIEVKKVAKVRRAKLFFLRGRRGKAARLSERFTTADEFAVAAAAEEKEEVEESEEAEESSVSPEATTDKEEEKKEPPASAETTTEKEEKVKEPEVSEEANEEETKS